MFFGRIRKIGCLTGEYFIPEYRIDKKSENISQRFFEPGSISIVDQIGDLVQSLAQCHSSECGHDAVVLGGPVGFQDELPHKTSDGGVGSGFQKV